MAKKKTKKALTWEELVAAPKPSYEELEQLAREAMMDAFALRIERMAKAIDEAFQKAVLAVLSRRHRAQRAAGPASAQRKHENAECRHGLWADHAVVMALRLGFDGERGSLTTLARSTLRKWPKEGTREYEAMGPPPSEGWLRKILGRQKAQHRIRELWRK